MDDVEDVLSHAPSDVCAAVRWLVDSGGEAVLVTPRHGMGFSLMEFSLDEIGVRVVSDRDEWSLDLRRSDQNWLQFELIYVALTGDETAWSADQDRPSRPFQHPPGVSWRAQLPPAVEWMRSSIDAESKVASVRTRRATTIWGDR